ncbi:MAG TPA: aldo/keto reductase [Xanthobacteraceae bacterium]|jgi:aryl-alcohol dehydrogenase-like predicted oxidoreductase|nr:aldo/keto reductase [Xanthobacteraceae bacterium]
MATEKYEPRKIGNSSLATFPVGLGCASLSGAYGPADEAASIALIHDAMDRGVTFFDTSDKYGNGHNEDLIARAVAGRRDAVIIATKFGNMAGKDGKIADGRPDHVAGYCDASLRRLKTDVIDLYFQHRIDPAVPIEDTVGAMARLVEQGKVRALGLCEASPATLQRAHAVHPISAIQSEYSILYRTEAEEVLTTARRLGISFVAYAPLGRGLLTGAVRPGTLDEKDTRLRHPRFTPENLPRNLELVQCLEKVAADHGCTAGQVSLAWLLAQGEDIIPIPGTKSPARLAENVDAAKIVLTSDEVTFLSNAIPPGAAAGLRYRAEHMKNMYV